MKRRFRVQIRKCAEGETESTISLRASDKEPAINKALRAVYPGAPFFHQDEVRHPSPQYFTAYGRVARARRAKNGIPKATEYGDLIRVIVTDFG